MGDGDNRRVEARLGGAGRGLGGTPEAIEELQRRAAEGAKLQRPAPSRSFGAVLAAGRGTTAPPAPAPRPRRGGPVATVRRQLAGAHQDPEDDAPPALGPSGKVIVRG